MVCFWRISGDILLISMQFAFKNIKRENQISDSVGIIDWFFFFGVHVYIYIYIKSASQLQVEILESLSSWYHCVVEIRAWILEAACCEFSSKFTPSHLTVWTVCSKSEASPPIYWSLGKSSLFFLWCFGLSNLVSVIIREQKGLMKRVYLEVSQSTK